MPSLQGAAAASAASTVDSRSSTSKGGFVSYDSDDDFTRALTSYNISSSADAMRHYLSYELQSSLSSTAGKLPSAHLKGKFYERFNQILDRIFGNDEISKAKHGGWLEYSVGVTSSSRHRNRSRKSSNTKHLADDADMEYYVDILNTYGRAMIRLLGARKADEGSIFYFLFRTTHAVDFKFEMSALPEPSKAAILGRSAYAPLLFTQLLHKPLSKQMVDVRNPVLLVNIKELYLFYFLRHPVVASAHSGRDPHSSSTSQPDPAASLMRTISGNFSRSKSSEMRYSWSSYVEDGVVSLTKGNPYAVLLLQYLRVFLPGSGPQVGVESRMLSKIRQHSNLFLHALVEFWLRQNHIVYSDGPAGSVPPTTSTADAIALAATSSKLTSPFAAVHTSTSYMAPTEDLLSSLVLTLIHLLSDSFYPVQVDNAVQPVAMNGAMLSRMATGGGGGFLSPNITLMRKPLFEFIRLVFSRAPIGLSATSFLAITDVWLTYLQPWNCKSWALGENPDDTPENVGYSPEWESYVLANYHFYTVLLGAFVERARELDLTGTDKRNNLPFLGRVLNVFNNELLELLRKASTYLSSTLPYASPYGLSNHSEQTSGRGDTLLPTQAQILTYYCKSLGMDYTAVPLHGSYHRDAERLFDKLWNDSGIASLDAKSSSSTQPAPLENVQRISKQLRRIFEIPDAYVSSATQVQSFGATANALEGFEPARDSMFPHLLTKEGLLQLRYGMRQCDPSHAAYLGDPMLRPIRSYEIPWLVRFCYRFSLWLNDQFELPNPYHGKKFEDNLHVDPAKAEVSSFRFNLRFLASKPNLLALTLLTCILYLLFFW